MSKIMPDNKGVALIMVLWVLFLLMVIVLEFSFAMRVEVNATRNFKDEITCYFNAQGGFQRAVAELIIENTPKAREDEEGEKKPWRADQRKITMNMSRGNAEITISDEAGKYNLNTIPEDLLRNFIGSLGAEEVERDIITDSILDWRDENNLHRINGAEDDYYESLPNPYSCKDGLFDTVEELLLVRGITPPVFYGCHVSPDEEKAEPVWQKGLVDLVTVYSRSTRIDVNTAPREILMSIPGLSEEVVESIIQARSDGSIKNLKAVKTTLGNETYAQVFKYLSFSSARVYSIVSTGFVPDSDIQRSVKGVVSINPGSEKKYQVVYWADNYPDPENLIYINQTPWETGDQEPS